MNNKQSDPNQGDRDQGFLDKQTSGSSSGGVENWSAPQQSSGQYSDWGSDSERRNTQMAGASNANMGAVQRKNGMAITGFVLSIISLILCWLVLIDLIFIIPAIVFSAIGLRKANQESRPHGGLAIAGLVISGIALIIMIVIMFIVVNVVEDVRDIVEIIEESENSLSSTYSSA